MAAIEFSKKYDDHYTQGLEGYKAEYLIDRYMKEKERKDQSKPEPTKQIGKSQYTYTIQAFKRVFLLSRDMITC